MAIYGGFTLPSALPENVPVYSLTRTVFSQTDAELLATIDSPIDGAIAIIDTVVDGKTYGKTSFMYSDTNGDWVALVGNVDADKVILRGDITLAGNYTQVGNLTKTQTGTATFSTDGISVAAALKEILSKRVQPSITANPSVGNVTISPSGAVEAGTIIASVTGSKVTFDDGAYTYEAATGVTVTGRTVTRVTSPAASGGDVTVNDDGSFTDTGADGTGFQIGDQGGEGVLSNLKYTETVSYSAGNVAKDNLGDASNPVVKISAGSVSKTSAAITPFRKYFYGYGSTHTATIDSDVIRSLTNSTGAASNGTTFTINITDGTKEVIIAYPGSLRDITSIEDKNAFGTDIKGSFTKSTVQVEGANGYTAIDYKVYVYHPDVALGANTLTVKI